MNDFDMKALHVLPERSARIILFVHLTETSAPSWLHLKPWTAGRTANSSQRVVGVKNLGAEDILRHGLWLRGSAGRKTAHRVKDRQITGMSSVQGALLSLHGPPVCLHSSPPPPPPPLPPRGPMVGKEGGPVTALPADPFLSPVTKPVSLHASETHSAASNRQGCVRCRQSVLLQPTSQFRIYARVMLPMQELPVAVSQLLYVAGDLRCSWSQSGLRFRLNFGRLPQSTCNTASLNGESAASHRRPNRIV